MDPKVLAEAAKKVPEFKLLKDFVEYLGAPGEGLNHLGVPGEVAHSWAFGILIDVLADTGALDTKRYYDTLRDNVVIRWETFAKVASEETTT